MSDIAASLRAMIERMREQGLDGWADFLEVKVLPHFAYKPAAETEYDPW